MTKSNEAVRRVAQPAEDKHTRQQHNNATKGTGNRPTKYRKKPKPLLPAADADKATSDALLRQPEGWFAALLDLREAAQAGSIPAPFAALAAIRCVMDGLVTLNELLPGASGLQL